MKKLLTLFIFCITTVLFSQRNTFQVVSENEGKPIPFANIEWGENGMGIAADAKGFATISKVQLGKVKEVYISAVGYALTEVSVSDLLSKKVFKIKQDFQTLTEVEFEPIDAYPVYDNMDKNKEKYFGDFWVSADMTTKTFLYKKNSKTNKVDVIGVLETQGELSYKTIASKGNDLNINIKSAQSTPGFNSKFFLVKKKITDRKKDNDYLNKLMSIGEIFSNDYVRFSIPASGKDPKEGYHKYFIGDEIYNKNKRKILEIFEENGQEYMVIENMLRGGPAKTDYGLGLLPTSHQNTYLKSRKGNNKKNKGKKSEKDPLNQKGKYRRIHFLVNKQNNLIKELYTKHGRYNAYNNLQRVEHSKVHYKEINSKAIVERIDYVKSIPLNARLDEDMNPPNIDIDEVYAYTILKLKNHQIKKKSVLAGNDLTNLGESQIEANLPAKENILYFRKKVLHSDFLKDGRYLKEEDRRKGKGERASSLHLLDDLP